MLAKRFEGSRRSGVRIPSGPFQVGDKIYLTEKEIRKKIERENLIENYIDLETQIKENSFDLTLSKIEEIKEKGKIDFSNEERHIPSTNEIKPRKKNSKDKYGWWMLSEGNYLAETNEEINIPKNTIIIQRPRLSVTKSGVRIPTQVLTSKEPMKTKFSLQVNNKNGFEIKENARIITITFIELKKKKPGFIE